MVKVAIITCADKKESRNPKTNIITSSLNPNHAQRRREHHTQRLILKLKLLKKLYKKVNEFTKVKLKHEN